MVWQVNDGSRFNAGSANHFTFPITSADPTVPAKTQAAFNNVSTYLKDNTDRQLLLTGYYTEGSNQVNMDQALKNYFADLKYYISQVPTAEIEVSGHTDNVGSLSGNTRLSKKRATEIKSYMERQGVKGNNITSVVGEGPNKPLATNDTDEGKAKNRRVEIIVIK